MPSPTTARDRSLDALKGVAIVLVVAGHGFRDQPVIQVIHAFHMPLFMFAAGITMSLSHSSLLSRVRGLLVPYFAWVVVTWALVPQPSVSALAGSLVAAAVNPRAALWFLYVLFICSAVLLVIRRLPGDTRVIAIALGVAIMLLPHPGGIEPFTARQVAPLMHDPGSFADFNVGAGILGWRNVWWLLPFFLAGCVVDWAWLKAAVRKPLVVAGSALSFVALLAVGYPPTPVQGATVPASLLRALGGYAYIPYRYAIAFAGIALAVAASGWLGRARVAERALVALGGATLGIYALHSYFLHWLAPWAGTGHLVRATVATVVATVVSFALTELVECDRPWATILLGKRWPGNLGRGRVLAQVAVGAVALIGLGLLYRVGAVWSEVAFAVTVGVLLAIARWWRTRRDQGSESHG